MNTAVRKSRQMVLHCHFLHYIILIINSFGTDDYRLDPLTVLPLCPKKSAEKTLPAPQALRSLQTASSLSSRITSACGVSFTWRNLN